MSRKRGQGKAAQLEGAAPSGTKRRIRISIEMVLWLVVATLLVHRVTPQVRAAFGFDAGSAAAPPVAVPMLAGGQIGLADLRGQVVLVNFWATWCPPCRLEMPGFQDVYEAKRAQGFTILGISADDGPPANVQAFLTERGITYPVGMNMPQIALAFGGVNSYPTSFLIDRSGNIRYVVRGIFAEAALAQAVDRLLAES